MASDADTTRIRDGASSVVIDVRPWPVVIATWFGEPTEDLVRKYFAEHATLLDRARRKEQRIVLVTDTFATQRPSAKARKLIADLTSAQPDDISKLTLGSFIVIESVLIRGAVTALRWILPRLAESESVDSIGAAFERAAALLDARGIPQPKGLVAREYRRPSK
jgi:hypothetical protein